jgi:hypothetical protein
MSVLLTFRKLGGECRLRVDDPEVVPLAMCVQTAARTSCAPCGVDQTAEVAWVSAGTGRWRILLNGEPWEGECLGEANLYFQTDHLLDGLARLRWPEGLFLHAGAAAPDGLKAVLFCGSSGAGKTSLVTACILAGWAWLTDELVLIEPGDGWRIRGARRNFNLKKRSFGDFPETAPGVWETATGDQRGRVRFFDPDALGGGGWRESAPVGCLVFPEYRADCGEPVADPLGSREALGRMAPEIVTAGGTSAVAGMVAGLSRIRAFRLRYRDPRKAVPVLGELMEALA